MYRSFAHFIVLCGTLCFSVLQATWSAPVNISTSNESNVLPQIAVDHNGNATVTWLNTTHDVIQAASRSLGEPWQPVQDLSQTPIVPHSYDAACVAMDGHGNATAVWMTSSGGNLIQASTKPFDGSWQEQPDTISVDPGAPSTAPKIAMDSNGNATAVWVSSIGSNLFLQASTKPFGGSWQTPVNVSLADILVVVVSIAVDSNGNVTAVWFGLRQEDFHSVFQAATKPFGGDWQEPVTLAQDTPQGYPPSIAIDRNGNATAVWQGSDGTNFFVQSSCKPFNGAWQETPDTLPGSQQANSVPDLAVDSMGNATAVWEATNGPTYSVRTSTKPFGSTWQPSETVFITPTSRDPKIAVDNNGNATAVWVGNDGTNTVIQTSTKPFGGSWPTAPDILSLPSDDVGLPQIAVDGSNNVTVVWISWSGPNAVIQAATNFSGLNVTSVRPTSGPQKGGNTVTITGTNFVDVASVYFGSISSPSFIVDSPTTITAIVPEGKGIVDVTVTASSRTSPVTPADQYTYRRFKGKVKHHRNKLFVKTKWNKSAAHVTGYEIFARKKKIITIPAQNKAQATIHLHPHHIHHEISNKYRHYVQHKYKVRAIDADGTASAFTFLNIHR